MLLGFTWEEGESGSRLRAQTANPYLWQLPNLQWIVLAGMGGNRYTNGSSPYFHLGEKSSIFLERPESVQKTGLSLCASGGLEMYLGLWQHLCPHTVPAVSSGCLGMLQGANEKLCISRQAVIFQIQSSNICMYTLVWLPLQMRSYKMPAFISAHASLGEVVWIRTNYENVPVSSLLMKTTYWWSIKLCM